MSPLSVLAQPVAGQGSTTLPPETICDCALCDVELRLLATLSFEEAAFPEAMKSMLSHSLLSVPNLVRLLRELPAGVRSDEVLGQLLKTRATQPIFIDSLLVLAFVPMLHRTVRRVVTCQPALAEEDVVQQALATLLEFLRSEDMRVRQSHFAFAISRAVKRQVFAWAAREGTKHGRLDHSGDAFPPLVIDEPFERYAQLRHFLHRCATRGDLTDSELDLLIRFKLEGTNGEAIHGSNGNSSNAARQKLKRLLAKLRRLAR